MSPSRPLSEPSWREVKSWQYIVLFEGEPFGFSHTMARAEIKVSEREGIWNTFLTLRDTNGLDVGSIATDYSPNGNFIHWQRTFADGQPLMSQSMTRKNEVDAYEIVSLGSDGIEHRSSLKFDLEILEPAPVWMLRTAFVALNADDSGTVISATLNYEGPTQKWVSEDQIKWTVVDSSVMFEHGKIEAWKLAGVQENKNCFLQVYVSKEDEGLLLLQMNSDKGALMLGRAGS